MVTQPLDLYKIFVEYLAGSMDIFFFLAMAFFAFLAAKFKMPNFVTFILMGVFVVFFANYYPTMYLAVIFFLGYFFYYVLSRTIKQ